MATAAANSRARRATRKSPEAILSPPGSSPGQARGYKERRLKSALVVLIATPALLAASVTVVAAEVTFTDIAAGLPGVENSSMAWGDYDNDGDLDILLTGWTGSESISRVYRDDGAGMFTDVNAGLPGIRNGSVAWGDYDNDGDLDILLAGSSLSRLYRNNGNGTFSDINAGLPGVWQACVAWGDYDDDGDLDIFLAGGITPGIPWVYISSIYRNDGSGMFIQHSGLTGVVRGSVACGDYDNDGDLDILLAGEYNPFFDSICRLYQNDGTGRFAGVADFPGTIDGSTNSVAWGDYDSDGDLDIVRTGFAAGWTPLSRVYRNDGAGVFTDINASLWATGRSSAAWGDYDNDGDLDILLTGQWQGSWTVSMIFRNDGAGVFTGIDAGLQGVYLGSIAWGDYDNDGDLDILLSGGSGPRFALVYRSAGAPANAPPAAPSGLSTSVSGGRVVFNWNASSDGQTPAAGLSYNLRIGTTPGGSEITSPMADVGNGQRRVAQLGHAQWPSWVVRLSPATYYWSVQAIDTGFKGSAWSLENTLGPIAGVGEQDHGARRSESVRSVPNPFRTTTQVIIDLPEGAWLDIRVFDLSGRVVRTLASGFASAGKHTATWGGIDDCGRLVEAGKYFCRLRAGSFEKTQAMVLVR